MQFRAPLVWLRSRSSSIRISTLKSKYIYQLYVLFSLLTLTFTFHFPLPMFHVSHLIFSELTVFSLTGIGMAWHSFSVLVTRHVWFITNTTLHHTLHNTTPTSDPLFPEREGLNFLFFFTFELSDCTIFPSLLTRLRKDGWMIHRSFLFFLIFYILYPLVLSFISYAAAAQASGPT